MTALFGTLPTTSMVTLGVAACSLVLIIFWPATWGKAVPGSIVAVILGTLGRDAFSSAGRDDRDALR